MCLPGKQQVHHFANKDLSSQSCDFSSSHVRMWELDHQDGWVPKNWWFWAVVLEKTLESPLDCKEIQPVHPKGDQSWIFIGRTDAEAESPLATWWVEPTHWKRPWCRERLKAGGEGDDRGWDGWRASPTQWTWVWTSSGSWWWTGKSGMLQSMEWQRVGHEWVSNWTTTECISLDVFLVFSAWVPVLSPRSLPLSLVPSRGSIAPFCTCWCHVALSSITWPSATYYTRFG